MKQFLPQFLDLALPLLSVLGMWALYSFANWARGHLKAQWERDALQRLTDAIYTGVLATQKLTVDDLKAKSADGKLSAEDAKNVLDAAVRRVKDYLGAKGVSILRDVFDTTTLEHIIEIRIEALLANFKRVGTQKVEGVVAHTDASRPTPVDPAHKAAP